MPLISINPATEEINTEIQELTSEQIEEKLSKAHETFLSWREISFEERASKMMKLAEILKDRSKEIGEILTKEMGKPISQAIAEVEKCAWVCEYYAENAEKFLSPEVIETEAQESYVRFDPIGIVFAVMPWNYPFWQVMRFAAPALMAGNVGVLKHASNVPLSSAELEKVFLDAGFPEGAFTNLHIKSSQVEAIIADDRIKATTLTGSEYAGSQVAMHSGKYIKKSVMELGGSDPYIILADAELDIACDTGKIARLQNNGQSCIAAKRFIVVESIWDEFIQKFKAGFEAMKVGDPMDPETEVGPLYAESGLDEIDNQVKKAVSEGAEIITGGERIDGKGYYYKPTILANIEENMSIFYEEFFGPVAMAFKVKDEDEAIKLANNSPFGLGSSLWTKDTEKAKELATRIESGGVFINSMTKSDPRLPFGGVKKSGYGRELSKYGIKEFVNVKTVMVK